MTEMRLQRALARAGVGSRRRAEDLIRAGHVRVNGYVAELGMRVDPERDVVTLRGRRVRPVKASWIALHKPPGTLVSRSDPRRRATVFELLPEMPGLTYVGRLDLMTEGLLLLTTDGQAAQRLTHPRYAVPRTYRARVAGRTCTAIRRMLARAIEIEGRRVVVENVSVKSAARGAVDVVLTLREGRYRIVRRICSQLGLRVERLTRTRYGPVHLGRLPIGAWRWLTHREEKAIETLVNGSGS